MFDSDTSKSGPYYKYAAVDKEFTVHEQGTGLYQCYCEATFGYGGLLTGADLGICNDFMLDMGGGYLLTEAITVLVTVVNLIIRDCCILLIRFIGFHTVTVQTSAIMTLTTAATFFNTAILLLLTNANTSNTFLRFLPLTGAYTDLTENWFIEVGDALVWTMLINSVSIYLSFAIEIGEAVIFRSLDKGCGNFWRCRSTT